MKQGLVRLLYNFGKRFMGWTLHMIMCVLLCYPVSIRIYYQQGVLFLVLIAPGWPNMPWFLGPGSHVKPDPTVSAQHTQPSVSAIQPGPSQEPVESEPTCLAPRASAIKEQGFSEAVAAQIEAPQRRSTRSVYEAKWTIFTKWCLSNQVDFRAPPLKAIADFLLHLFQEKKLQPSTIDGYRSAIAD